MKHFNKASLTSPYQDIQNHHAIWIINPTVLTKGSWKSSAGGHLQLIKQEGNS